MCVRTCFALGFDVLEYQEHIDYELIQSNNPEFNKAITRVNFFRDHRQTIQVHYFPLRTFGYCEENCVDILYCSILSPQSVRNLDKRSCWSSMKLLLYHYPWLNPCLGHT